MSMLNGPENSRDHSASARPCRRRWMSEAHTPQLSVRTNAWPAPGSGVGISSTRRRVSLRIIAFMVEPVVVWRRRTSRDYVSPTDPGEANRHVTGLRRKTTMASTQEIEELLAKQAIRDQLSRYCRALDRMDKQAAYDLWHEGATTHFEGGYEGTGHGFVDWVWGTHAMMRRHSHQITNVLVEVDGGTARSEAYYTVVLWLADQPEDAQTEIVSRGRYLDRWSKRDGRWAIDERLHLADAQSLLTVQRLRDSPSSARDESDPSFRLFSKT